jgi:hypothetical protein
VSVQGTELVAESGGKAARLLHSAQARAKASNRRDSLVGVSGRSVAGRRFTDLVTAIGADQGGLDQLSEVRLQLIRRFATLVVLSERQEVRLAQGEDVDVGQFTTLANGLIRYAALLGLDRIPRAIEQPLSFAELSGHVAAPVPAVPAHEGDDDAGGPQDAR